MKILITCGGTGGHVFPAIALAHELKSRGHEDIAFIVDNNENARKMVEDAGFSFISLDVPRMPYGFSVKWFSFVKKLIGSYFKAGKIIKYLSPDIAIGFGAYVTGPVISSAKSHGVRTIIHEQNAVLGRANSLLLAKADKVCFSFDHPLLEKGGKYILTGNPVREELVRAFDSVRREDALGRLGLHPGRKTIMILGGSLGATSINNLVLSAAGSLDSRVKDSIQFIHITGSKDKDLVENQYKLSGIHAWVSAFSNDMALLYKASDMIICRCGASTLSEICLFGVPALLIPYPWAGSHQADNAKIVARSGGAIPLEQKGLTADALKKYITNILFNDNQLKTMSSAMKGFAAPLAVKKLAESIEEMTYAK